MNYRTDVLREAIQEALNATEEEKIHRLREPKIELGSHGAYERYIGRQQEWRTQVLIHEEREYWAWDMVQNMCRLIGADMEKAVAIEKAIRRNSQYHHHWQREAHIAWNQEDKYRRAVEEKNGFPF